MYTRLTKITNIDGRDCVTCAFHGTPMCHLHTNEGTPDCSRCEVIGAIFNQLYEFEEIIEAEGGETSGEKVV